MELILRLIEIVHFHLKSLVAPYVADDDLFITIHDHCRNYFDMSNVVLGVLTIKVLAKI